MKITKIEIKNFKAFRGPDVIDLSEKGGQSLLLYGENGSGKTSLYKALELFLESSENDSIRFIDHQNIFATDDGYVRLHFTSNPDLQKVDYEWSENALNDTVVQPIIDASKAKRFLDYKELLKTNYLHYEHNSVNVFDLLVNTLLKNVPNDQVVPPRSFSEQWEEISDAVPLEPGTTQEIIDIEQQLEIFNTGLKDILDELEVRASQILRKFGYEDTIVALKFGPPSVTYNQDSEELNNTQILLKVDFFENDLPAHHRFLNEAKLSAIALSIFFAGFTLQPPSDLKILALDDALIGLDMSNRLPVLDILDEKEFEDYQIFLMTYDRAFYEMAKHRKSDDKQWKTAELYRGEVDGYEIPVYVEGKAYIDKAKEYLRANDYKACAIYVRTALEAAIKQYCEKRNLAIKYRENPKDLRSEDFWVPIKMETNEAGDLLLDLRVVDKIELARKFILNELSHDTFVNIYRKEVEDAIDAVAELEAALISNAALR